MKIRRLPELDLARIAPQRKDQQRKLLEQMRFGRPPFSYGPLRACFHDIFNVQPELFGPVAPTDWTQIEATLRCKSKSSDELKANLAVAKGLHQFALTADMRGRQQDFYPLAMSMGQKVSYWLPMVLAYEEQPIVPFIDPRRSRGLSKEGRRFAFSMMHERIRAADPDFEEVRLAIIKFGDFDEDRRHPKVHTDEGVMLFTRDELEQMVTTTYSLWTEVLEGRADEARRFGTSGPLL